jgi:hypothetical protein
MSGGIDIGNLVWNAVQQTQINKLDANAEAVQGAVAQQQAGLQITVEQVEGRVAALALICRALFELLQEKTGVTQQELAAKITAVDVRDGKADGRMTPQPMQCPACQSMMAPRFNRCLFCGYKAVSADPFNIVK